MPLTHKTRKKVKKWIREGVSYSDIIRRVEELGDSITKGGISYIKSSSNITKQTKLSTKPQKQKQNKKENDVPKDFLTSKPEVKVKKLLSEAEVKSLAASFKLIEKSNLIRYKHAEAVGMLNALSVMETIIKAIIKRGDYEYVY